MHLTDIVIDEIVRFETLPLHAIGRATFTDGREYSFTAGRVIVRGAVATRGKKKRADYLLNYRSHRPACRGVFILRNTVAASARVVANRSTCAEERETGLTLPTRHNVTCDRESIIHFCVVDIN